MRCRYCQQRIPLLRKLTDTEFCSEEHRLLFLAEQEKLALARLVEAQQRFAEEALQAARAAARHRSEATAPEASFLFDGPAPRFLPPRAVGEIERTPLTPTPSMPRLESSEAGALSRKPSPLTRPRAAAAWGNMSRAAYGVGAKLDPAPEIALCQAPVIPVRALRLAGIGEPASELLKDSTAIFAAPHRGALPGLSAEPRWEQLVCVAPRLNRCGGPAELVQAGATAVLVPLARMDGSPKRWVSEIPAQIEIRLPRCGAAVKPDGIPRVKLEDSVADLEAIPLAQAVVPALEPQPATPDDRNWEVTQLPCALSVRLPEAPLAGPGPVTLLCSEGWAGLPAPRAMSSPAGPTIPGGLGASAFQYSPQFPRRPAVLNAGLDAAFSDTVALPQSPLDRSAVSASESLETMASGSTAALPRLRETKPQPEWEPAAGLLRIAEPSVGDGLSAVAAFPLEGPDLVAAAVRVPKAALRTAEGELGWSDRLRSLTVDFIPQNGEFRLEGVGAPLSWGGRHPSPPALQVTPAAPAAMDGDGTGADFTWRAAGMSAVRRFWDCAPAHVRWLAAAATLLAGFLWYSPFSGRGGAAHASGAFADSVRTVSTLPAVAQFISTGWSAARQGIAARAGVELFDDFRSGLSAWEGRANWAQTWSYDDAGFVRTGALGLFTPSLGMSDYDLEFLGRIEKKALNWVVRAQDANNYYAFKLVITRPGPLPSLALVRYAVLHGKEGPRTQVPVPLVVRNDTLFRIRTIVRGSSFTTMVQGVVVDTWSDDRLSRGGIGFFSSKGEQSLFRWVTVTHQYDTVGKLCAFLAPFSIQAKKGD